MKKLLILILFLSNLYGQYYIQNYIAEDHTNFKEAFYEEYKNKQLKEFTIKFKIDLEKVQNKTNYLTIISDKSSLVFANIKYEIINDIIVVKLDKNQNNELLFKYIYDHPKRVEFRWNSISDFEYTYLLKYEGILYGVSYGIIFCAFLYYIIILLIL